MATRIVATAALALVLLGACTAGGAATPSASAPTAVVPSAAPAATTAPSTAVATARPTTTPLPTALTRPADVPKDGTCDPDSTCQGLLQPGKHHTKVFVPGFSFSVPAAGWENLAQRGGHFDLTSITAPGDSIGFVWRPGPTNPDGTPVFGVQNTVAALGAWLEQNKDLAVSPSTAVTIGGLKGRRWDISLAPTTTVRDKDCPTQACVGFLRGTDPSSQPTWAWDFGLASSERARVYLLDGPTDMTAIIVDSLDGTTFDALTAAADKILASVSFDKP
jgi:hypothetical protein